MTTATRPLPPHGDPNRYWRGCRCTHCTNAASQRNRRNQYLRATGRQLLCSAAPSAAHIAALRAAGMEDRGIVRAARISNDTLYRIIRGDGSVHVTTEQRILAVPIPADGVVRGCSRVPAIGTLRRLRALVAVGWYPTEIARRLDKHMEFVVSLVNGRGGDTVTLKLAEAVRGLYQELSSQAPENHGLPTRSVRRARDIATLKDWRDPVWWEDYGGIDDPDTPEREQRTPRFVAVAEDTLWLEEQGYTREQIAHRLGVSRDCIQQNLRRWRLAQAEQGAAA